jgi:hypothetical protein
MPGWCLHAVTRCCRARATSRSYEIDADADARQGASSLAVGQLVQVAPPRVQGRSPSLLRVNPIRAAFQFESLEIGIYISNNKAACVVWPGWVYT